MESCDVLIIGGGPAGSACANRLSAGGRHVVILDKRMFPRDKTCAGWITPQVVQETGLDLEEYGRGRVLQRITGFHTGMIGGPEVETHYQRVVSYGIRRCEFDHYLLVRSGARCCLGEPLQSLEQQDSEWIINGRICTPMLVGAGGHFCPVARRLGARSHSTAGVVTAQEVEFELPPAQRSDCKILPEVPELYFCRDLAGYGWCFRKGEYLNIGLGRLDPHHLSAHVAEFCEFLQRRGKLPGEIPRAFRGHAYQVYERTEPKLVDDGVLLVGDAAGLAYSQSGEGIRPAIESGLLAAEVLLSVSDYRRASLEVYRQRLVQRLGSPPSGTAANWLPVSWLHAAATRLLGSRWFTRHVVIDRWFLHTHQPALDLPVLPAREPLCS